MRDLVKNGISNLFVKLQALIKKHMKEIAFMSAGLVLVGSASNNLTMADFLQLFCIAVGLMLVPWAFRTFYKESVRSLHWTLAAFALALLLTLPHESQAEFNFRNYISSLLLVYYCLPLTRASGRVWWLWHALLSVMITFELLPWTITALEGAPLSETGFGAVFQTNPNEAREYLATHIRVFTALPYVAGAILLLWLRQKVSAESRPKRVVTGVLALSLVCLGTGILPIAASNYRVFKDKVRIWEKMARERARGIETISYSASAPPRSRKILLVLGESTTRRHMGLYGYPEPTTPRLQAMRDGGELFAFDQVVSPQCYTTGALAKVLTTSNNENHLPFAKSVGLIDVMKKAGFKTYWVSNQNKMGIWDNEVSVLARTADKVRFASDREGKRLDAPPDEVLLPLLDQMLPKEPGKVLLVCHLMGAHVDYSMRVPPAQRIREGAERLELRSYDQAIRYGDFILAEIIQKAEAAGFDLVVYLSDHGECPHDGRGHNDARFDPEMCEIPFLIWLSKGTRAGDPALVHRLREGLHRPFMSDGFFHTLLDLAGVSSSLLDLSRSVVNPRFRERPRLILGGKAPYVPGTPELHDHEPQAPGGEGVGSHGLQAGTATLGTGGKRHDS